MQHNLFNSIVLRVNAAPSCLTKAATSNGFHPEPTRFFAGKWGGKLFAPSGGDIFLLPTDSPPNGYPHSDRRYSRPRRKELISHSYLLLLYTTEPPRHPFWIFEIEKQCENHKLSFYSFRHTGSALCCRNLLDSRTDTSKTRTAQNVRRKQIFLLLAKDEPKWFDRKRENTFGIAFFRGSKKKSDDDHHGRCDDDDVLGRVVHCATWLRPPQGIAAWRIEIGNDGFQIEAGGNRIIRLDFDGDWLEYSEGLFGRRSY